MGKWLVGESEYGCLIFSVSPVQVKIAMLHYLSYSA